LRRVWIPGAYAFDSVFVFFGLANRTLLSEGKAVFDALDGEGLEAGRRRLSWIVGRDTGKLSAAQIGLAVLESMSENLSDGVVAPLLFYAIGGVPAMLAYKMVNTLDSMIGYKREPYRLFGRFAARLDDVANFIPARVTGLLMVLVTGSWRGLVYLFRYGHAHSSPNSGYPESALAGIMHCRFGGPNSYNGVPVVKPYIGVREREIGHREFAFVRYINHAVTVVTVAGIILLDIFAL
jgi:adenosylcobinamide-phosphate synthase